MFSKLKSRKAPLSLNSISNTLKTKGAKNLSPEEINAKKIDVAVINQIGVPKDSITAIAYDPVQSLLAIATKDNDVRIFGQINVEVVFEFNIKHPIVSLRFVKGVYLLCTSPGSGLTVLSLHSKQIIGTFSFPGTVTAAETDPSLDWAIFGLANGSLIFYDVDRLNLTQFRIDNLQKKVMPKEKMSPVVSIEWHPRDIGTLLVAYNQCAIVYSLVTGQIKCTLTYTLLKEHKGFQYSNHIVTGGKKKLFGSLKSIIPLIKEAHFHPNGLHAVTVHNDNTLVFWDIEGGVILEARTLYETQLHRPGAYLEVPEHFNPIEQVKWICGEDPEETRLLVSGGDPEATNTITVLNFGYTLKYSMTSHEKQGIFYSNPQNGQSKIPINFYLNEGHVDGVETEVITEIQPVTQTGSPYFQDGHNPSFLLLVSNLGRLYVVSFSDRAGGQGSGDLGNTILPTSLSLIVPPLCYCDVQSVIRIDWYSIMSSRASQGVSSRVRPLLYGGAPVPLAKLFKPLGYNDGFRNIMITGHENGLVRFIDITKGEQLGGESIVQVALRPTLYDYHNPANLKVIKVSCSFQGRQLLVGLASGEVVICKFGKTQSVKNVGISTSKDYSDCPIHHGSGNALLVDISGRISGSVATSASFLPLYLLRLDPSEQISVLKMSDSGFAAVGYKSGRLVVCDISRGPAVIFNLDNVKENLVSVTGNCYPTVLEFSIMEFGMDRYSSLVLNVGTNCGGNLLFYKITPIGNGGYQVEFANKTAHLNYRTADGGDAEASKLLQLIPIDAQYGLSTVADEKKFNQLATGVPVPGYIITVSDRDIRVITPPKTKLSHKVVDDVCLKANVVHYKDKGVVLALLVRTGFIKLLSLPSLHDIANIKLPKETYRMVQESLESGTALDSDLLSSGEMFVRTSETESVYISAYEKSKSKDETETDKLFNPNSIIPPRPSASTLLWAKGQISYVSVEDLAMLIAGPNRKAPKTEESTLAHNISPEANPQANYGGYNARAPKEKAYDEPVRKAGQGAGGFGTQGFMRSLQNGLQTAEETFNDYATSASQTFQDGYEDQKKSFYSSALQSKFGF